MKTRNVGPASATKGLRTGSRNAGHWEHAQEWTWMAASAFVFVAFFVSGLLVRT